MPEELLDFKKPKQCETAFYKQSEQIDELIQLLQDTHIDWVETRRPVI